MLRSEAINRIKFYLKNSGVDTDTINMLQDAQQQLEMEFPLPWFLESEITTTHTVIGEQRVCHPPGFLGEYDPDALYIYTSTDTDNPWQALVKDDFDFLRDSLPGSGKTKAYSEDGHYFYIFPIPDAIYTLKMIYYKADDILDTEIENKWLKYSPYQLIGRAGKLMAASLRDDRIMAIFEKMEMQASLRLFRQTHDRFNANRNYVIGGVD